MTTDTIIGMAIMLAAMAAGKFAAWIIDIFTIMRITDERQRERASASEQAGE